MNMIALPGSGGMTINSLIGCLGGKLGPKVSEKSKNMQQKCWTSVSCRTNDKMKDFHLRRKSPNNISGF